MVQIVKDYMVRQGTTKERILKLISNGTNTLSTISEALGFAPSTVSKHLHDLEMAGAIALTEDSYARKWKHYRLNQEPMQMQNKQDQNVGRNLVGRYLVAAIALGLVAAGMFAYYYNTSSPSSTTFGNVSVPISLTDPPQVPNGTQALYINYSSLNVHVNYDGGSQWIPVNASGRIDLMQLINESQVIGGVSLRPNSTVDTIKFNINAASITIDNVTYPVQIVYNQVTATVGSNNSVNSTSGILLDFSPIVTPVYLQGSESFVILPSLKAMIVPGRDIEQGSGPAVYGHETMPLPNRDVVGFGTPGYANVSITNQEMSISGNTTSFSLTVTNNADNNVTIMGVALSGASNQTFVGYANAPDISVNVSGNGSYEVTRPGMNAFYVHRIGPGPGISANNSQVASIQINASQIYNAGGYRGGKVIIRLPRNVSNVSISGFGYGPMPQVAIMSGAFGSMLFVAKNGNTTLSLPPMPSRQYPNFGQQPMPVAIGRIGYVVSPHTSVTFSYDGSVPQMPSFPGAPKFNYTSYTISVMTSRGITQANVTSNN